MSILKEVKNFQGIKNNETQKNIPDNFFYDMNNMDFRNETSVGIQKIRFPKRIRQLSTTYIDGLFEYRYLDSLNKLETVFMGITNGIVYKDILTTPVQIYSGLTQGKCTFTVLNDKLYIANGKNYVLVYNGDLDGATQMGAPLALESLSNATLNGTYRYIMTYVTNAGEDIVGSISNTVSVTNKGVDLILPIGYEATVSRNLYRTKGTNNNFYFLTTIDNNQTLTYLDQTSDDDLGDVFYNIPNNPLPKPYFIKTVFERLIGAKDDQYPTQLFLSDFESGVFDLATSLDISNYADDNTAINGIDIDFSNIVVGTDRHIYLVDASSQVPTVTITRANVGVKTGYSMQRIFSDTDINSGLIFVSTENDIRILQGLQALPVATSLDNIRSSDLSNNVSKELKKVLLGNPQIDSAFYNYKYYLVLNGNKYVLDLYRLRWTYQQIRSSSYYSQPYILSILNNSLFNGQSDGWIEEEFQELTYRGEEVEAFVETAEIETSTKYVYVEKLILWFFFQTNNLQRIELTFNDDTKNIKSYDFTLEGHAFDAKYFNSAYYDTQDNFIDYKIVNVYNLLRWIKFKLINVEGTMDFQSWAIVTQDILNKEG